MYEELWIFKEERKSFYKYYGRQLINLNKNLRIPRIRRLLGKNRYRNDEEEMNIILRTVCVVLYNGCLL